MNVDFSIDRVDKIFCVWQIKQIQKSVKIYKNCVLQGFLQLEGGGEAKTYFL